MSTVFRRAERQYLTPPETPQKIIGRCENCSKNKTFTILTSDYQTFKDRHNNLFCSEECALEYYGVEEMEEF